MFIYLSKKIAIPNNTRLNCVAWNKEQGYIAVGGSDGLLKVLRLDSGADQKFKGLAATSNLTMNQTLEGHTGEVQVIVWNEIHQKLTTSDQNGLIIVWMLYKGSWYEEMVNNRNKSTVKGMSWSADGQKICIVYEDGWVIVGSVEGNRIWGRELKGMKLNGVQWSPNAKFLLFGQQSGEIHLYDAQGVFVTKVALQFTPMVTMLNKSIVSLDWYDGRNGFADENCPCLVICYHSGHMQLMRSEYDDKAVIVDTNMTAVGCRWNHNGSVLAVVGSMTLPGEKEEVNVMQFFTPFGEHLRTLKVPGDVLTDCSWEGGSLRVALSVDSHIYFANIRPDYNWTSMHQGKVVVYAFNRMGKQGSSVCFWDTKTQDTHIKQVNGLLGMTAYLGHCLISLRGESEDSYKISLYNSISTLIDTKEIDIQPLWLAINATHVFVASYNNIFIWGFKTSRHHQGKYSRERIFHVDDIPCGVADVIQDLDPQGFGKQTRDDKPTSDPICCIAVSDKILLVARESGLVQHYSLPNIALVVRYSFPSRPYSISINCDSTKFSLIDHSGVLTFQPIQEQGEFSLKNQVVTSPKTERRDVWAACWAFDNPMMLATMEKTRMYVLRNEEPEEPIISCGYVCGFKDLEIRSVLLDEIMKNPENPSSEFVITLEVKSLRDTRELLSKVGIAEATQFIEDNPHPVLWRLLAESALRKMDFVSAESAFVRFTDLQGVQFVKRLQNVHSEMLRKAEVATFLGEFDEAEKIFCEMDRKDLALQMRERLGDWFGVSELIKNNAPSDQIFIRTNEALGDYYCENLDWKMARNYYKKSKSTEKELNTLYMLEDWDEFQNIISKLPEKHPLLRKAAELLASVGLCTPAVEAYVKIGDIKTAMDVCIGLANWSEAIKLAVEQNQTGIADLLAKNAKELIESGKILEAIDFLCKAQQYLEAAKFMFLVADEEKNKNKDLVYLKKLYVSAALIWEEKQKTKISELNLVESSSKAILSPWRPAEAYHFLILAQKQLQEGNVDSAFLTCHSLVTYEDFLDPEEIYSLLALSSVASQQYGTCSKALIRLQEISSDKKSDYENLALDLFSRHSPKDAKPLTEECEACFSSVPVTSLCCPGCKTTFPICVVTGRVIFRQGLAWCCTKCHHFALAQEIGVRASCPLCHAPTT